MTNATIKALRSTLLINERNNAVTKAMVAAKSNASDRGLYDMEIESTQKYKIH